MRRIRMHQTSARPRMYEIWYAYSAGSHPALNVAVDEIFARQSADFDQELDSLHDRFFAAAPVPDKVGALEARLEHEVIELGKILAQAVSTGANYSDSLTGAVAQIPAIGLNAEALRMVATNLLQATRQMQEANRVLDQHLRASRREVLDLQETLSAIQVEAMTDSLTLLANRRAFDVAMRDAIKTARTGGRSLSLILADIDNFKQFNDTHGHLFGDQVLRLVAHTVKARTAPGGVVARFGGEEFALVLPDVGPDEAYVLAERIRGDVKSKSVTNRSTGQRLARLTISLGVAAFRPGDDMDSMTRRADACLYAAKRGGRNQVMRETALDLSLIA